MSCRPRKLLAGTRSCSLDLQQAAARLMRAIERTTEEQVFTPDLGGVHDTRAVTQAVKRALP